MAFRDSLHDPRQRAVSGPAIAVEAVRALRARLPALTDRLLSEFGDDGGRVPAGDLAADLERWCRLGMSLAIEAIEDPRGGRADLELAARLGSDWAAVGLPLESLLRLYRLAGRRAVGSTCRGGGSLRAGRGLGRAASCRTGHSLGRARRGRSHALDRRPAPRVDTARPLRGHRASASRSCPDARKNGSPRLLWRMREDVGLALASLGDGNLDQLTALVLGHAPGGIGVSSVVEELADVGGARRMAELMLDSCTVGPGVEVARLDQRLPTALITAEPELGEQLKAQVLGAVLALEDKYRCCWRGPDRPGHECRSSWARARCSRQRDRGQRECRR